MVTLLFAIIPLTQDILRQPEGTTMIPVPVVAFAVWLCGTLMLERARVSEAN